MRSGPVSEDRLELEAYLRRIGLSTAPTADLAGLAVLHEAHCATIPFENLDILLGRPIALDLTSLQAKLVAGRRGGYCFEHNTLFAAVLEALGFSITRLAARVRSNTTEVRPRTHMLLRVDLPEGAFVADVGFGGEGCVLPVSLETQGDATSHRVVREGGESRVMQAHLTGAWTDLYAFTLEPQHAVDYEMANHFTSTHARSPFVLNLTAQRAQRHRRSILRNRDLVVHEGERVRTSTVRDADHLLEVLAAEFDLVFGAETRFAKPDFR